MNSPNGPSSDCRVGIDRAFEHELGVRGHADAVLRRAHDFERRAEQAAGDVALVLPGTAARAEAASMNSGCAPITMATGHRLALGLGHG